MMKACVQPVLLAAMLAFGTQRPTMPLAWWSLDDTRTFVSAAGTPVRVTVLTVSSANARMRVVSIPFEVAKTPGSTELSLRSFAQVLSTQPAYRSREWIVVNGGFSSYQLDVPLGLLVVDGKVYSRVSTERPRRQVSQQTSEYTQYRWSGILCQMATTKEWQIIPTGRYAPGTCTSAIQAGPVVVEPNARVGIAPSETRDMAFVRTVICLGADSSFKIALTQQPTNLFPLAQWLSKPAASGGLGCQSALNLSGDNSSGIVISTRRSGARLSEFGDGSFPLATALVFEPK